MRGRSIAWILVAALAGAVAAPARATVVLPADLEALSARARAIVRGQIVRVRARESADRQIERVVTLQAATYYKGNLGSHVDFLVPGGTLGRYRTVMMGAPEYREGEEVVLFLNVRGASMPYVLGLYQGTYRITDGAEGGRTVMAERVQAAPRARAVVDRRGGRGPVALPAFEARVRQAVARAGASPEAGRP